MDAEFDELKREFLAEAEAKVLEIRDVLAEDNGSRESFDRITYLAHQLKGAGGSYGFSRISTEAAALEGAVEQWASSGQKSDEVTSRMKALTAEIELRARELNQTVS